MTMNAIIVEDEYIAAERLKRMVKELNPEIQILHTFESIEETAEYWTTKDDSIDLVFLDVELADGNSFELFNLIDISADVIFTTAYNEYAVQAFRQNALDYLMKPIKENQLKDALNRLTSEKQVFKEDVSQGSKSQFRSRFLIKFGSKLHSIKVEDIAYIFSKNKLSYFYLKDGSRYPSNFKLQDLEDQLDSDQFFRANRQFIIHIESLDDIIRHDSSRVKLRLTPPIEEDIVVSTEKTKVFKEWLKR